MIGAKQFIITAFVLILLASNAQAYDISYSKETKEVRYSYYDGDVHKRVVYYRDYYPYSKNRYSSRDNYYGSYSRGYYDGYKDGYYSNKYNGRYSRYNYKYSDGYYGRSYSKTKYYSYYDNPKYMDRYYM